MLSREEAAEQLDAFRRAPQTPGVRSVPSNASPLARRIAEALGEDAHRIDSGEAYRMATDLDDLSDNQLRAVMANLCPPIAGELAQWWTWSATHQPYQRGWSRRAFRSSRAEHSRATRWSELAALVRIANEYPQPIEWWAEWALYLPSNVSLGPLLASTIDAGHPSLTRTLIETVSGAHPLGGPSKHGYAALLSCGDPAAWTVVTEQLLAAERAEGLRQTILEAADLGNPDAFARILDAVIGKNLVRFASTVRAVGVWFDEQLTISHATWVATVLEKAAAALRRPQSIDELGAADPLDVYIGLWALGLHDAQHAVTAASTLLGSEDPDKRLAAAKILVELGIPETVGPLVRAADDESLPVLATALSAWPWTSDGAPGRLLSAEAQAVLRRRFDSLGASEQVDVGLIVEHLRPIGAREVAQVLLLAGGDQDPALLAHETGHERWLRTRGYAEEPERYRAELFSLLVDRSSHVRNAAARGISDLPALAGDEALLLEGALTRTASDLREMCLTFLQKQDPDAIAASVQRLSGGNAQQRRAAAELRALAGLDDADGPADEDASEDPLPPLLRYRPEDRTPAIRPQAALTRRWSQYHVGAARIVRSLEAWLAEHSDVEVQTTQGVELLSNITWLSPRDSLASFTDPWWERTQPGLTDGGVELVLLSLLRSRDATDSWATNLNEMVLGPDAGGLKPGRLASILIDRLVQREWRDSWAMPVLDLLETAASMLPLESLLRPQTVQRDNNYDLVHRDPRPPLEPLYDGVAELLNPTLLSDDQLGRLWRTVRFLDEPEGTFDRWRGPQVESTVFWRPELVPDQPFRRETSTRLLVEAFERGLATREDLIDHLVPFPVLSGDRFFLPTPLKTLSALRPPVWASRPKTQAVVAEVRQLVIDAELARGDLPTPYSRMVDSVHSAPGAESLCTVVAAFGKRPFARAYGYNDSRESNWSRLVQAHYPAADDTVETLTAAIERAGLSEARVIETAVYAPQWAGLVEQHLGWPGFESAVWWFHAHARDEVLPGDDPRRAWAKEIAQRTPVSAADRENGATDVAWFLRMHEALGDSRFESVLKAAKFTSTTGGHTRAALSANALRGANEAALMELARTKRQQDAVRAIGLLPLTDQATLTARYEFLRDFVASGRSGAARRASEAAAVQIGLENLARTAGYRDPQRLIWAMEAQAAQDLGSGPVTARVEDLTVSLTIDESGLPRITAERGGKTLAAVPAKSRKLPEIAALTGRAQELKKQTARMRSSLEAACVLGDAFETHELRELRAHPMLDRMLSALVMADAEGRVGFLSDTEGELVRADGRSFTPAGKVRIAHPVDLLASGEWPEVQHAIMSTGRPQPFRQAFRELYVLNDNEADERGTDSRRYSGQQIQARRAYGLFTARGWVPDYSREATRTFHQERITAVCDLQTGWGTAAEAEDAAIREVYFSDDAAGRVLPLSEVPPRVFSEVMRDLDLVVSVAHTSGVDPEASESTITARKRILDETAQMLGLSNVEIDGHHMRIRGELGTYSVHLGSGVVHLLPGNSLFIVPVSAQQRGRVFLPFVDDDPRTAEIVSKMVLLARDQKITDPTILSQIVS